MPVIGHAFVGMATALSVRPPQRAPRVAALWLPAMVVLAYLPDIANQVVRLAGGPDARDATHSIAFAFAAACATAVAFSQRAGLTRPRAFALAFFSILLHDALDLLQASFASPFWPISEWHVTLPRSLIPWSVSREAAGFAGLFAMFLVFRRLWSAPPRGESSPQVHAGWRRAGRVFLASILLAAGSTHGLRGLRERDYQRAESLLLAADYLGALEAARAAERWPSVAKPGRTDYLQAQAREGLGDFATAETLYRRSMAADPTYFWSLADYAVFVAAHKACDERARNKELGELRARLQRLFGSDGNLPRLLRKIDALVASGAATRP